MVGPSMPKSPNKTALIFTLAVVLGGLAYWLDNVKDETEVQQVRLDLTHMTMPQAITHCRSLWTAGHYDQAPLAISWHKDGLDWYVLEGLDETTMRHFGCNGGEVTRGARYERVMGRHVPAPASAPQNVVDRNLFSHYAALPDPGLLAFEATEHPATRELIERRWPKVGAAQSGWPEAKDFPILFRQQPEGVTLEPTSLLKALPATVWIKEPARVFSLLAQELPPDAHIAELTFGDRSITVYIKGTFTNEAEKTSAPFGEATFDEYGIRAYSWWYPRQQTGSSCAPGHTLKEVAAQFATTPNADHPQLWGAYFRCRSSKGALMEMGSWTMRVPRRR